MNLTKIKVNMKFKMIINKVFSQWNATSKNNKLIYKEKCPEVALVSVYFLVETHILICKYDKNSLLSNLIKKYIKLKILILKAPFGVNSLLEKKLLSFIHFLDLNHNKENINLEHQ